MRARPSGSLSTCSILKQGLYSNATPALQQRNSSSNLVLIQDDNDVPNETFSDGEEAGTDNSTMSSGVENSETQEMPVKSGVTG